MKTNLRTVTILLVIASLAPAGAMATTIASPQDNAPTIDRQAVTAPTVNFYAALNAMFTGDGQPMKDAWSHAEDITYMGPDGVYLVGWKAIEPEWNAQAAKKLGGRVTPQQLHTVVGADLAAINCIESGENIVNGKKEIVRLRSSTLFRKENGAWKVIGHQTDLLGYMNKPE